jgi:hypothetical protein
MTPDDTRLPPAGVPESRANAERAADGDRAIARYLYLLRTAPPEAVEQVHTEAFGALTDAQRRELLARIAQVLPPDERALATPVNGTPVGLARLITRAEMRQPGTVARLFGPGAAAAGAFGASLLGGIAGAVVGSAIASRFLAGAPVAGATTAGAQPVHETEADAHGSDDAGAGSAGDAVADGGSVDDWGFDLGLDDPFDA